MGVGETTERILRACMAGNVGVGWHSHHVCTPFSGSGRRKILGNISGLAVDMEPFISFINSSDGLFSF